MSSGWGRCDAGLLRGTAGVTARRRGRDFFCRDDKGHGNFDVGPAGADGARTVGNGEQVAEGISEAVVQLVSNNYPRSGYGVEQEILGVGQRHQFIL